MLVVVAPEQEILAEWRVVVVEGQVLTASQYKQNHRASLNRELPDAVQQLAWEVVGLAKIILPAKRRFRE